MKMTKFYSYDGGKTYFPYYDWKTASIKEIREKMEMTRIFTGLIAMKNFENRYNQKD